VEKTEIPENLVRIFAILAIAGMEYALICKGQDGQLLLPCAFMIGIIAGAKLSDIKEIISKKCD
jgi:hypothetical protein